MNERNEQTHRSIHERVTDRLTERVNERVNERANEPTGSRLQIINKKNTNLQCNPLSNEGRSLPPRIFGCGCRLILKVLPLYSRLKCITYRIYFQISTLPVNFCRQLVYLPLTIGFLYPYFLAMKQNLLIRFGTK